ncbi:MAG: sialate O-acetylesterase [Clostridia bacterium]|nr:sialate O-acetylesterase [Clostridia bacterium]
MPRFQLSSLFTDGAVLCRGKEIRVFGTGENGVTIRAALQNSAGAEIARGESAVRDGAFCVRLSPQEAQTGCVLTVSDAQDTVTARDILIGDVYWAGGQSNMELELQNADEGPELIKTHENSLVRYYNVPKYPRLGEDAEKANRDARWVAVAPGTAKDMSAAAYFFAMKLQKKLNVPIGIVDCYWGGTSITCWMDEEALQRTAEGRRYIREYDGQCEGKTMEAYIAEEKAFFDGQNDWNERAAPVRRAHPGITTQAIAEMIGPCPPWVPPVGPGSPFRPHGLFHTMLEGIIPLALTGVLFYQGEEDTWRTRRYDLLLISFIQRIRELFLDAELPFLNVQLPMWIDAAAEDGKLWPAIRMAQWQAYRMTRNTGLAVLLDAGEYDNIHPTDKRVVGERLYEVALDTVYHLPARLSPYAVGKYTRGNQLAVLLSAPVVEKGDGQWLMEIAGEDGAYYPASVASEGDQLLLTSPEVPHPVMARYAWTDYAIVRFFGENGLPLAPFVLA